LEAGFSVAVGREGQATLVRVTGELDIASSQTLERELAQLQAEALVVVDLCDVSFVDSSALGVLVRAHQHARAQGRRLGVVNANRQVSRLLDLTGLEQELVLHPPEQPLGGG
jgi:anti-sigma B factor antagonist